VPGCSKHNLDGTPNNNGNPPVDPTDPCETISIGALVDEECGVSTSVCNPDTDACCIDCGECYVVRAFSHNDPDGAGRRSAFSLTTTPGCDTSSCGGEGSNNCSKGFWTNHGNPPQGQNDDEWPIITCGGTSPSGNGSCTANGAKYMCIGTNCYSASELLTTLNTAAGGNKARILAQQLIAAELNIASGSGGGCYPTFTYLDQDGNPVVVNMPATLATAHGCLTTLTTSSCSNTVLTGTKDNLEAFNAKPPCHDCLLGSD